MTVFSSARIQRGLAAVCVLFPLLAFAASTNNHDARLDCSVVLKSKHAP